MRKLILVVSIVFTLSLILTFSEVFSAPSDASVPPKGSIYFKLFPEVFITSAVFDNSGTVINLSDVSQISHINTQLELYYSITDTLMAGFMLPVEYVRESYVTNVTNEKFSSTETANPWIIIKHQFLPKIICSASSIRIKLPIKDIKPTKEGFNLDDKQLDIYPVYYLDWQSSLGVYIYSQIGYKFRLKNDNIKPGNELKLLFETGYAIVPGIIRIFTCSDFTRLFKGKINENITKSGYLYNIGAGVRFLFGRNIRVEIMTKADPVGRNQFRGIGGHVVIGYVFKLI